ncbi:hypothetical protein COO60DRAFT_1644678 [Scenedesmus sp. NREL 46B-D3]|nr:hypothetical protein COO60DRAFT_1644678 [Scenedesmus sp. NREL 46B-D3]
MSAEAKAAAARTDELLGQEHPACTGGAETVRPEAAFDASAEGDEADTPKAAEEAEEAVDTADEAESEDPAAAAEQQGSAVEAGSEPFGLDDLLVPILQDHLQQHGKFRRSFHSYSIYLSSTCLLQQGIGDADVNSRCAAAKAARDERAGYSQRSVQQLAGDLIAAMRSRFGKPGRRGWRHQPQRAGAQHHTRAAAQLPWMQLSQPSGNAQENQLRMRLLLLGFAASKERLAELLPLLSGATCAALGVSKAGAAASAGLVAAVASEAVGTTDARKVQQGILAAAAGGAVRYYMNSSPAKLGRMWLLLQHGVPVGVLTLVRFIQDSSPAGQKGRVQAMTAELAAALEAMLATAKPYWVCLKRPASQRSSSNSSAQNGIWLFNVPLLLEQSAALRGSASYLLPALAAKAPAAAAAPETKAEPEAACVVAAVGKPKVAGVAAAEAAAARQHRGLRSGEFNDEATAGQQPAAAAAAVETADVAPAAAASALGNEPAVAAAVADPAPPAATGGRAAAARAAAGAVAASRTHASAAAAGAAAARARAAASARLAALYGPHLEPKRGPAAGLDYTQCLPGLGPVQVVTVSSAASAAYSSMLQHMAAVSLLGLDTESSRLGDDGSVTVVLSFMAPGVPASGSDPGWPDTVYIIDLAAAGIQQHRSSSSSSSSSGDSSAVGSAAAEAAGASAASELVAGLAAVFQDPGCTLVVQDASQDLPLLQSQFGLSAVNAIDTQLCYIALDAARQRQGLHVQGRPLMRRKLRLWLTAPRPLPPELLSYLVTDVRYLPALVLLMERDLMQASPGVLMRELQPALPRHLQPPLTSSRTPVLRSITQQQQQHSVGMLSSTGSRLTLPAVAAVAGVSSSSSSSSSAYLNSSWVDPGVDDTIISNLVFELPRATLSGSAADQLQLLLQSPAKPTYQLLVPREAMGAAERAVAATAAAAGIAAESKAPAVGDAGNVQQQRQQQQGQHQQHHLSIHSSNGDSSSSGDAEWCADPATGHLLCLLPERLAGALLSNMAVAAASFQLRQAALRNAAADPELCAAAAMPPLVPQLQQLHVAAGSTITYRLGVSGVGAAAASSSSSFAGAQEQLFQLKLPSPEAVSAGLMPDSRCSMETVQQCVDALLQHQEHAHLGGAGTVAAGEAEGESTAAQLLSGSSQRWMTSELRHFVAPILMPGGRSSAAGSITTAAASTAAMAVPRAAWDSMLRDMAATLADNSCVSVAAVDMDGQLAGAPAVQSRLLGRALQLQVDSAASQAAAVQSAWQLHKCRVIIINRLMLEALPAVEAALAAGAPNLGTAAAANAVGPAGQAAVLPVQLRQFMPAAAMEVSAAAAVDSAGQLTQQQQGAPATSDSSSSSSSSSSNNNKQRCTISSAAGNAQDRAAAGQGDGVAAVSRFASYGAAADDVPLPLLQVVRELLYGQAHHSIGAEESQ